MSWKPLHIPDSEASSHFRGEFTRKARFLVDESVGPDVARLLKRSGWNARYVGDVGLKRRDDEDVLAFALKDDRVLLTHDRDFLDERRFPEHRNPGIVILPGSQGDVVALIEALRWTLSIVGEFREVWRKAKVQIAEDGTFASTSREHDTGRVRTRRYRMVPNDGVLEWNDES